jgi:ABC-type Fe3+/spermidine/putrescine transport system ATPase subunit
MLKVENVTKRYKETVLDNVSFHAARGESVAILGPSGSGKSTLLNCITGFETPDSGNVILNNKDVTTVSSNKRPLGMVFQNFSLFPNMTARENVEYPLCIRKQDTSSVNAMLERVGMLKHADKYPKQLSGGQQQRVAIARAMIYNPDVILMDEPLASLDLKLRIKLQKDIKNILHDTTVVYVTHDFIEAFSMCDKVIVMNNGKIEQIGTPQDILNKPESEFVNEFVCETWKDYTANVSASGILSTTSR